ncbi:MAG: O-antigen ligase family protein [uncultured Sulfurovum sp.]|uniref:O-antigen ligase family protein n=1 Tax=uncultured Sulfurovum sp. TaxID=269237 RepID=A0A6S6SX92_9BACT|nr:MAG: O-antigen ligase family protein [uncultured Sulfurovum sp.]
MSIKLILFYLIGFGILYLEPIPIAGMTFGILWKLVLIFILAIPILYQTFKYKYMEMFAFIIILFAFKTLVSYSSMEYILTTLTIFIKTLMLPILYLFFVLKVKRETLLFLAKHYSILIILSFVPYILGLLVPLGQGYDLSAYGLDGQYGLVGPFLNPHSASISLAFAMIVISSLVNLKNSKITNIFYVLLIVLGFYELVGTYVRTGLAIYLMALMFIYLNNINIKKMMLLIVTATVLAGVSFYLISSSEVAQMRFEDKNKYMTESDVGSGRFQFWKAAVENWLNDDSSVIWIGLGEEYAKDKMEESVGLRIFAHNEFFQTLQQEGLIGFSLFIVFLFLMQKFLKRNKNASHYLTAQALFVGLIVMMSLQGGFYFNIVFLLSIYFALLKIEFLEKNLEDIRVVNER